GGRGPRQDGPGEGGAGGLQAVRHVDDDVVGAGAAVRQSARDQAGVVDRQARGQGVVAGGVQVVVGQAAAGGRETRAASSPRPLGWGARLHLPRLWGTPPLRWGGPPPPLWARRWRRRSSRSGAARHHPRYSPGRLGWRPRAG